VSPTAATTEFGLNEKPLCPTLTVMVAADALAARTARRLIEEYILLSVLREY